MDSYTVTLFGTNYSKVLNRTMGSSLDDEPIPNNISLSGAMVGVVLIITGGFGNFLVIVSVIRNKHLCKAANACIISLAVCDIFQNIAVKPLYVQTYITGQWIAWEKCLSLCLICKQSGNSRKCSTHYSCSLL